MLEIPENRMLGYETDLRKYTFPEALSSRKNSRHFSKTLVTLSQKLKNQTKLIKSILKFTEPRKPLKMYKLAQLLKIPANILFTIKKSSRNSTFEKPQNIFPFETHENSKFNRKIF